MDTVVQGVRRVDAQRPRGYAWTVWHATAQCVGAAHDRGYYIGDPRGDYMSEAEAAEAKVTKVEEGWLEAYDEAPGA